MRSAAPIPAFALGFGFMRAWALTFLSKSGVVLPLSMLTEGTLLVFAPIFVVSTAVVARGALQHRVRLLSRPCVVVMAATLVAGSLLMGAGERLTLFIGEALGALGFSLLLLQWGDASSRVSHRRLLSSLMVGFVVAGALCLGASFASVAGKAAVFAAYPVATGACLLSLASSTLRKGGCLDYDALGSGSLAAERWAGGGRQLLARLAVALFAMELVARSTLMLSGEYCVRVLDYPSWSFEMARFLGTVVAAAVFFALDRLAKQPLRTLYALVPSTLVCSCLFVHFGGLGIPYVTYAIAFTAGAWLEAVFWVFFSHSCTAVGKPPIFVWSVGRIAFWASTFVGIALWSAQAAAFDGGIVSDGGALTTLVVLMALGVVLVYTLVLPGEKIAAISILRDRELETRKAFKDMESTIVAVADRAGLSPREREVFAMLAHGRDTAHIQERLFISQGTVRSHRDRIYRKLNVHSKQELLDLVEREFVAKG